MGDHFVQVLKEELLELGFKFILQCGVKGHCHKGGWWAILLWYRFVGFDVVLILKNLGNPVSGGKVLSIFWAVLLQETFR